MPNIIALIIISYMNCTTVKTELVHEEITESQEGWGSDLCGQTHKIMRQIIKLNQMEAATLGDLRPATANLTRLAAAHVRFGHYLMKSATLVTDPRMSCLHGYISYFSSCWVQWAFCLLAKVTKRNYKAAGLKSFCKEGSDLPPCTRFI